MRHPNLFILGAQRAGTTWLSKQMMGHPEIFFSTPKETLFMGRTNPVTQQDYKEYLDGAFASPPTLTELFFGQRKNKTKYMAEGSANYFQSPFALDRIRVFVPGTPRFIICLRQPVSKGISFFIHNWRRGRYKPGTRFRDTLTPLGQLSPLFTSLYAESTKRWLAAYPRDAFLFLKYEDLARDPISYLQVVSDFLQIKTFRAPVEKVINKGLPLVWNEDNLTTLEPDPADPPPISMSELKDMYANLLPDIRLTQELTGLDLSDWLTLRREDLVDGAAMRAKEWLKGERG